MKTSVTLSLTKKQHLSLYQHLFPQDGLESAAILLCGRREGDRRHRLVAREVGKVPYEACSYRSVNQITWKPEAIEHLLNRAADEGLSVVKVHSHPSWYPEFSETDDKGDQVLLPTIQGWAERDVVHGSVIMLPDGKMFGRILNNNGAFTPIECINVIGDDLHFWYAQEDPFQNLEFAASHAQIFDDGTIEHLRRLSVAVVGCSGTGSPVIEMLSRLGVGELVLVDDDQIEERNLNRILNSTIQDVKTSRKKVEVLANSTRNIGLGTKVIPISRNLWNPEVVKAVAQCDVIFGCMDTIDGRYLLNRLATYYTIPYFDIGIRLVANPDKSQIRKIREVCGTVHYLQPGLSSLISRKVFSLDQVSQAGLQRTDPTAHAQQIKDGYIAGVVGHRPAVIHVNMQGAVLAIHELLARLHPFREEHNQKYASVTFSLSSMEFIYDPEGEVCEFLSDKVGIGDTKPLLGELELSSRRQSI